MSLEKLGKLYRTVVLEHAENPHHKQTMADATVSGALQNLSCGDEIRVFMKISAAHVQAVSFMGTGCTISQASASMMTDTLCQCSVAEAQHCCQSFFALTMGQTVTQSAQQQLGDAELLASLAEFPARIKCATLAWHAALTALKGGQTNE
ncbi:Fe-S cluster assembly sulfur transfer protein SufU [Pediococcus siamensis]|uniref:Fe-S cluster assembly sulfur transfer protein SufU n=1 Tax=Pediococcus siamensis TaxID=381829 RepID=UPI00399FBDC4